MNHPLIGTGLQPGVGSALRDSRFHGCLQAAENPQAGKRLKPFAFDSSLVTWLKPGANENSILSVSSVFSCSPIYDRPLRH
jgi:hypothetical protein